MIPHTRSLLVSVALLTLALAAPAAAVVPGEIDYQGLLLDDQGDPVNGSADFVFTLHDAPSGGNLLWTESHPGVPVQDGVYDVELGSSTPLTPALVAGGALYLEIEVDGETLTPRQRLVAVPYALRADTAEVAETAQSVGTAPQAFVTELYESYAFDGADPPNDDPREGFADTDGDGLANFLDPDNDGDGIPDGGELAAGSDINLVTPAITGFDPPDATPVATTTVTVQGSSFEPGMSVVFGSETPVPQNVTPASFDVDVGPQPLGSVGVQVTRTNGQSANATFEFAYPQPAIAGFDPASAHPAETSLVTVNGTGFGPDLAVSFGSEDPVPQNVTPTSFEVSVGPQPGGSVPVTVSYPDGKSDSASFDFIYPELAISDVDPPFAFAGATTMVTVTGSGFGPDLQVSFGSENPVPQNVTPTSFEVSVGPQTPGEVTLVVSYPLPNNGSAGATFHFSELEDTDPRVAFVTSNSYPGDLSGFVGIQTADLRCAARAASASLPGVFLAWMGDGSQDPASRFAMGSWSYERTDGVKIADDFADLTDGTLDAPLDRDETGSQRIVDAWTGLDSTGTSAGPNCNAWMSRSSADEGQVSDTTLSPDGVVPCDQPRHVFCFQQY